MKTQKKKMSTEMLVTGALMTALVILFQLLATYTTFFGPFSTAIGLVPIAIGSILCGPAVGAWLGFVFAIVVFATGGANLFLAVDVPGTIVTVLSKGVLCGLVSGFTYKALSKFNSTIAAFSAAIVCPVVNTGVFLLGCFVFFMDDAVKIAEAIKSPATGTALFIALALGNFLFELGLNTVLSPVVVKILNVRNKG
ncbi:MAG: ECF transporter S component [Clostridia bacterium]|nr:ECF transporter S component [Clostridia bacterium]